MFQINLPLTRIRVRMLRCKLEICFCFVFVAAFLFSACHRELRVPPRVIFGPEGVPQVRVLLLNRAEKVSLKAGEHGILVSDAASGAKIAALSPGERWDVVRFGSAMELRVATPDGQVSQPHPQGIRVVGLGNPGVVEIGGRLYRGAILIYSSVEGRMMVVNSLPVEQYLRSVVPAEIGPLELRYLEALKAQAVASRSYAMSMMERNRNFAFDLSADTGDQVYKGMKSETPAADRAVYETIGQCLTYKGRVVPAFYHSTCGGRTAEPEEVWGRQFARDNPYLKSVKDGDRDRESKWYSWKVTWTRRELLEGIRKALPSVVSLSLSDIGEPQDIEVMEKGRSGRNVLLKVTTEKRVLQITGDRIRRVLRQPDGSLLPSTWFNLSVEQEPRGAVIIAQGKGFGHGLGMCQTGAKARAADGDSYRSILKAYYRKVKIVKVY
jgi:stage II sporulation protein D